MMMCDTCRNSMRLVLKCLSVCWVGVCGVCGVLA